MFNVEFAEFVRFGKLTKVVLQRSSLTKDLSVRTNNEPGYFCNPKFKQT